MPNNLDVNIVVTPAQLLTIQHALIEFGSADFNFPEFRADLDRQFEAQVGRPLVDYIAEEYLS